MDGSHTNTVSRSDTVDVCSSDHRDGDVAAPVFPDGSINPDFFQRSRWLLMYNGASLEGKYHQYRARYGNKRFLWCCLVICFATTISTLTFYKNTDRSAHVEAVTTGSFALLEVFLLLLDAMCRRRVDAMEESIELETNNFPSLKRHLLLVDLEAARDFASLTTRVREIVCLLGVTSFGILSSKWSVNAISNGECRWLTSFDDRPDHSQCLWGIPPPWLILMLLLTVLIGRPRFALHFPCVWASTITDIILVSVSSKAPVLTMVSRSTILFVAAVFATIVKYLDESGFRDEFEAAIVLSAETKLLRKKEAALQDHLAALVPLHLREHLVRADGVSPTFKADVAIDAFAMVVEAVNDPSNLPNKLLPHEVALQLGLLGGLCAGVEKLQPHPRPAACHGIHHVRSIGDTSFLVAGLYGGASNCANQVTDAVACVEYAAYLVDGAQEIDLRIGIEQGSLFGMPVGREFIRYDVFGPALECAHTLTLCAPSSHAAVSPTLGKLLEQQSMSLVSGDPLSVNLKGETLSREICRAQAAQEAPRTLLMGEADEPMATPANECRRVTLVINDKPLVTPRSTSAGNEQAADASQPDQLLDHHQRGFDVHTCSFVSVFLAIVSCILAITVAVERHDDFDAPLGVAIGLLLLATLTFVSVFIHGATRSAPSPAAITLLDQVSTFAASIFLLVGVALCRPSTVGFTALPLVCVFTLFVFNGTSMQASLSMQLLYVGAFFTMTFTFRPLVVRGHFLSVIFCLGVGLTTRVLRQEQHQRLFEHLQQTAETLFKVQEQKELRGALMRGSIPQKIQPRIRIEDMSAGVVDHWSVDCCVVMNIKVWHQGAEATGLSNPDPTLPTPTEKLTSFRDSIEKRTALVERAVRNSTFKSIEIVHSFSGTMVLAGLAEETADNSTNILRSVVDAMEIASELLAADEALTIGVAVEQTINALRLTEFPAFDIFGRAPTVARALMMEAPAPIVVVTDRVVDFFTRECLRGDMPAATNVASTLSIGGGESWRVKGVGSLRVHQVRRSGPHPADLSSE